jgi:hypothetical protein
MKRFISLMLIVAISIVCLCSNAQSIDVLGKWHLSDMVLDGQLLDPNLMGISMVFDLKADGTVGESIDEGTWVMDSDQLTITINNCVDVYAYSNDQFTGGENSSMIFTRELKDSAAYIPGDIVTKPSLRDFDGEWTVYMLDFDGGQLPAVAALDLLKDSDMVNLRIHNSTAFFSDADGENAGEIPCELLEGELVLKKAVDINVVQIKASLRLHKDGVISMVGDILHNGKNTVIYYKEVQMKSE